MIYGCVLEADDSVVKVGYTGSPHDDADRMAAMGRMRQMQTGNWRNLICIAMSPGTEDNEQALHSEFAHYNVRGEWFLNHGEVQRWVKKFAVASFKVDSGRTLIQAIHNDPNRQLAGIPPTSRQAEIHRYMLDRQSSGLHARVRDIARQFGISSTNGVADHLKLMSRKGMVVRSGARWIAVDTQHQTELVMSGSP